MTVRRTLVGTLGTLVLCFASAAAFAADPPAKAAPAPPTSSEIKVPAAAQPSAHFDPEAATVAYLALIPPAAKVRSDAYFEGGYWLLLWDFLYGALISLVVLNRAGMARNEYPTAACLLVGARGFSRRSRFCLRAR